VFDRITVWEWADWLSDQARPKPGKRKKKQWTALYVVKE
jgi:hypothetical protein